MDSYTRDLLLAMNGGGKLVLTSILGSEGETSFWSIGERPIFKPAADACERAGWITPGPATIGNWKTVTEYRLTEDGAKDLRSGTIATFVKLLVLNLWRYADVR